MYRRKLKKKKPVNLPAHLLIVNKTNRYKVRQGSSGAHWFYHSEITKDFNGVELYNFGEHIIQQNSIPKIIPELQGHILSFQSKSDAFRFKLAASKYVKATNVQFKYIYVNAAIVGKLIEFRSLHRNLEKRKQHTKCLTPVERALSNALRGRTRPQEVREFLQKINQELRDFAEQYYKSSDAYRTFEEKSQELRKLLSL